jgi:hypothetical protein
MGYDMTTERIDEGEAERVAELRKKLYAAWDRRKGAERDSDEYNQAQADADALQKEMAKAEKSYFRLNVWGMSMAINMMHTLGMIDIETTHPEWPDHKAFDVSDEQWNEWDWEITESTPQSLRDYHAAHEAVIGHKPELVTGICVFKFGSNDGWLVTPEEIETALAKAPNAAFAHPDVTWWFEWIAWLGYCKDRGGFRVH